MTGEEALARIRLEYLEMPDLKLTLPQVGRLCDLPLDACESAINALVERGFLQPAGHGCFILALQTTSR